MKCFLDNRKENQKKTMYTMSLCVKEKKSMLLFYNYLAGKICLTQKCDH